jgi:hypothetical protein
MDKNGVVTFRDVVDVLFDSEKQKYVKLPDGYTYEIYNKYQISILKNRQSFSKIEIPDGSDYNNCTVYIAFAHDANNGDYNYAKRVVCESKDDITKMLCANSHDENEKFCKELLHVLSNIIYDRR